MTRTMGGAVVHFRDGGEVELVEVGEGEAGSAQVYNVTCMWYAASKVATLNFTSREIMNQAAAEFRGKYFSKHG